MLYSFGFAIVENSCEFNHEVFTHICVCICCFFITSCPDLSLVFRDEIISKLACCLLFLNFHISNFFQYLKGYSFVDFISRGLQINFTVKINLFHLRFCIFISALFAFLPSTCCYFVLRYVAVF